MIKTIFILIIILLLVGCSNNKSGMQSDGNNSLELTKLSSRGITDQQPSDQAKAFLSHYEEISGLRAVNHDGYLLVAVKVDHHERFDLDDIESDLKKDLRRNFSELKTTLSTDEKIFIELKKLEEDILAQDVSKDEISKRLKKINHLSKEET